MRARYAVPVFLLAGASVVGVIAYRVLLTDSARENLRASVKTANKACKDILDVISSSQGAVIEEDVLPNRVRTEEQWEALGV